MKLSFFGADQCVTGSCHCLEVNGKRILIDCGLQQGRDETDNRELPFAPNTIDYVLITHAHIDHTGRVPLLVREGFTGQIWTTRITARLMEIMLIDSAHIQQSDAEYENRKNLRAGRPMVEPLYTIADAERVQGYVHTRRYGVPFELCEGVTVTFSDAGHLLGSASITLDVTEDGVSKTIVFSGDIGNINQPIIRDPVLLKKADYVVMESTYGDRNHQEVWSYTSELSKVIDRTLGRGGNVVIPAFAVGRTQEILYFLRRIKQEHLVKSVKDFPVYIDSPLASKATTIFCGDLRGYLDEEALELVKDGTNMFSFPGLRMTESVEESKLLNADKIPKVIISASGMCDAGRVRHHADRDHLLEWAKSFENPTHFFVVHGDREVAPYFAQSLEHLGLSAHAPQYTEVYDLAANRQLERGYLPERKTTTAFGKVSSSYQRLVAVGKLLQEVILRSKGRANKDLSRFADQIKQLIDKWEA